jgi:threonine/homoserine/homoserine lactone efflux protein
MAKGIMIMPGIHHFWAFLTAGVLLNLTPGQDTLYIVGRSLAHGRKAGIASALGICTGGLFHASAAAFGLSAVLATSTSAFTVLKWLGAAYLIFLGLRMLANPANLLGSSGLPTSAATWVAYRQGILTNITNPKVAIFFLAFLPQFIEPAAQGKVLAFLLLGVTFNTTGLIWCMTLALAATRIRVLLVPESRVGKLLPKLTGTLFVLLGIRLAASKA